MNSARSPRKSKRSRAPLPPLALKYIWRKEEKLHLNVFYLDVPAGVSACGQSVFAAVAFFYGGYLPLKWQLLAMVALGFAGTLCFFAVERTQSVSADSQED